MYFEHSELRRYSIRGLKRLTQAYQSDTTITGYSLEFYINNLNESSQSSAVDEEKTSDDDKDTEETFKDLWNDDEIKVIELLFKQLLSSRMDRTVSALESINRVNKTKYYLKALQNILKAKDECVQYRIRNATTKI